MTQVLVLFENSSKLKDCIDKLFSTGEYDYYEQRNILSTQYCEFLFKVYDDFNKADNWVSEIVGSRFDKILVSDKVTLCSDSLSYLQSRLLSGELVRFNYLL